MVTYPPPPNNLSPCASCGSVIWGLHAPDCGRCPRIFLDPGTLMQRPEASGDPDGPLVPLPAKALPERVVPAFPLTAYQALLR